MVSDRGKSYEAEELVEAAEQKCLAHLLRNGSEVVESKQGRARQFGMKLKVRCGKAGAMGSTGRDPKQDEFRTRTRQLDEQITRHLRRRIRRDADNGRF